jgi:hypothetical protein
MISFAFLCTSRAVARATLVAFSAFAFARSDAVDDCDVDADDGFLGSSPLADEEEFD